MKQIIIGGDSKKYILKLLEKNKWKIYIVDLLDFNNLNMLSKSDTFVDGELLIQFDTSLIKLNKQICEIIKNTHHHIAILTEDIKKVPVNLRKICEVKKLEVGKKKTIIDAINGLGKGISLEELKKYPLGQLVKYLNVNWQKFENKDIIYNLLLEVNKRLYKVGDDYLYLYLLWGFPQQKRKTFFRYPTTYKYSTKESIIKKVAKYYNQSMKEAGSSWWLVRRIVNNEMADKFGLNPEERKLLGLKKIEKKTVKIEKKKKVCVKTQGLF